MSPGRVVAAVTLAFSAVACGADTKVASTTAPLATTTLAPVPTTAVPASSTTAVIATTAAPTSSTPGPGLDPRLTVERIVTPTVGCSEVGCTSIAVSPAGEIVTYDGDSATLTFLGSGRTVAVHTSLGELAYLVAVGPDDVAYLLGPLPGATDPLSTLVAIATTGPAAGQEVAHTPEPLDGTGDATYIATAAGIMQVGCCGYIDRLPPIDNPLALAWVTPAGELSGVVLPEVFLEYPNGTDTVVVRSEGGAERRWTVPTVLAGRDMPPVAATADGGALVWLYDGWSAPEVPAVLYDLRPDGSIERYEMGAYSQLRALHSSRFVVVEDDLGFVRLNLP